MPKPPIYSIGKFVKFTLQNQKKNQKDIRRIYSLEGIDNIPKRIRDFQRKNIQKIFENIQKILGENDDYIGINKLPRSLEKLQRRRFPNKP